MVVEQASTFGAQVRLFRQAAGLSQEQLAERAGLAASASLNSNVWRGTNAFVGRENELVALRAKLAEGFAGRGSVLMLVDEAPGSCVRARSDPL